MPIHTIRPGSTLSSTEWTSSGAGTFHGRLADDSDSTWNAYEHDGSGTYGTFLELGYAAMPALPVGAAIRQVRVRIRARAISDMNAPDVQHRIRVGSLELVYNRVYDPSASFATFDSAWFAGRPGGGPWTEADIAALQTRWRVRGAAAGAGGLAWRAAEAFVDVEYNERPASPTVTGPADPVTDTTRPSIAWTYSDPEGDPQGAFEVEVYSGAHATRSAGAGSLLVASGVVNSAAGAWTVTTDLLDGQTYTAFVRVRQEWSGPELWSPWSLAHTFAVDLDAADVPILTATADLDEAKVVLELEPGPDAGAPDPESYRVQYLDDSGGWVDVRGAGDLPVDGSLEATVDDHEAPLGVARVYRARSVIVVDGLTVASGWSADVPATLDYGRPVAWLVDVRDPARLNVRVEATEGRERTWHGREVAHHPADLTVSVVESEPPWRSDVASFIAADPADHDALVAAFGSVRTLLYRDDRREHLYFRWVGDRTRTQIGPRIFDADTFEGVMVEVARPAP